MGDIDKSDAQFIFQTNQFILHILAQFQVQCSQRLIQQEYLGFVDDGPGDGNALLLTSTERIRHSCLVTFQVDKL